MSCLIGFLIVTLVAVIVLWVLETAINSVAALPPQVWLLVRVIVALIVLLYGLQCLGLLGGSGGVCIGRGCS